MSTPEIERRNRQVATISALVGVGMLGLAYAAVPLYRMFCQVTGFAGTTQRVSKPSDTIIEKPIRIRFDANVGGGLGWRFEPIQRTMDIKIGENALAFYRATNTGAAPSVGSATFNVSPDITGAYFNKLECFCFTEQALQPGETVEMPVSFYIDPAIVQDKDGARIREITLSYTFYPVDKPARQATQSRGPAPG